MVRGLGGEALGVVERQLAVDLVGRHVMQPYPVSPYRLEDRERTDHVGPQKRFGICERIVDVGFGRKVHDDVSVGHEPVRPDRRL